MPRASLTIDEIMAILPATVPQVASLTSGLSDMQLAARPEPAEWSATELLAHMRAAQDVLGANITRIVREDRPAWRRLSPRERQRKGGYNEWAFGPAFEAFSKDRAELLTVLEPMSVEDWDRVAVVTVAPNRSLEQTASFFGDWLAGHERDHLEQLERTIDIVSARGPHPIRT